MKPRPHQVSQAEEALAILDKCGLVYLNAEERTGKTLTALLVARLSKAHRILVLTKKRAIDDWESCFEVFSLGKDYELTNYHKAKNLATDFDLVILDEAHCYLSGYPKKSKMWKEIRRLTIEKPIIYISATPCAQGYQLLYHQFALSSVSPWKKYKTFYAWFRAYGVEKKIYLSGRAVNQYTETKSEKIILEVQHLFVGISRKELSFKQEPVDILHYVELTKSTKSKYNRMLKAQCLLLEGDDLLLDTPMKLRTSLHMLEGGVAKNTIFGPPVNTESDRLVYKSGEHYYYCLGNIEKAEYILGTWGDTNDVVIMYNYIAEGYLLRVLFKQASILQGTSNAEGIDLSNYKHLVIYSQDFSTSKHTQRRARQANNNRQEPIDVHFLLIKGGISEQVYKTVSVNKENFVDKSFKRTLL